MTRHSRLRSLATAAVFVLGCVAVAADSCEPLLPVSRASNAFSIELDDEHPTASIPFEIASSTARATGMNLNLLFDPTSLSERPATIHAAVRAGPLDDSSAPLAVVAIAVSPGEDPGDAASANADVAPCDQQPCTQRFVLVVERGLARGSSVSVDVSVLARVDLDDEAGLTAADRQSTTIIIGDTSGAAP